MDQADYESNCKKMQEKMIAIAEALLTKVKSTTSPIDYLVTMKKLNGMMENYADGFATLGNIEFKLLEESTKEGDDIIVSGATIKAASDSHEYEYPECVGIIEDCLKKAREACRKDGSAKKGDRRNKRNFTISLP